MDPLRTKRVSEAMREELSELVRFESADPRIQNVEVTEVHLASDLRKADILVSLPADAVERQAALDGLEHARYYLRRQLMTRLNLHRMPELRFLADSPTGAGRPVKGLLRKLRRGRPKLEESNPSGEGPAPPGEAKSPAK